MELKDIVCDFEIAKKLKELGVGADNKNLLHYIFMQINELYQIEHVSDEISDFLLDLTNNISQINANEEQSKKIIDLALASAQHFRT